MLKKTKIRALVLVLLLSLALPALSACDSGVTINVINWGGYIDTEVLRMFTEETGIRVNYTEFISNEDLYVMLDTGAVRPDVVFPSDYMIERMIKEGMLLQLDFDNIPNFHYVGERFQNLPYDPENLYSVPYKWGTLGILYNPTMLEPGEVVDSWDILWDARYAGQIFMHSIARESFAVSLKRLGFSANTTNIDELHAARDELIAQKPLVQAYVDDEARNKMIGREGVLAATYNGNSFLSMNENPELRFAIPREGTMVWYDSMVIPAAARNKAEAEAFINFFIRPDIAAMNAMYTEFSIANKAAFELLPEKFRNSEVYWPPEEKLANAELLVHLGDFTDDLQRAWIEVQAS